MKIKDIETKILEEKKAIEELESKKKAIEEKIALRKQKVEDYENMRKAKQYSDMETQLDVLGLSREELLMALMKGDLLELQDKILNQQKGTTVETGDKN